MEDEEFQMMVYTMLQRQYDLLAIIARSANREATQKVMSGHAAGKVYGSIPLLVPDEDE